MRYRVVLSDEADRQRQETYSYYREKSLQGAKNWYRSYLNAVARLRRNPERYPQAVEAASMGADIRRTTFGTRQNHPTHSVLYVIEGDEVLILALRHRAQDEWQG